MKRLLFVLIAALMVLGAGAQTASAQTASKFVPSGTLSDEDVAELKETFTDPKTGKEYKWVGKFEMDNGAAAKKKAKLMKKAPFRITGALYELKKVGGKKVYSRQPGTCWVYIKDSDGKVVSKATKNLNTMCPS
jgi:hypothetical protein